MRVKRQLHRAGEVRKIGNGLIEGQVAQVVCGKHFVRRGESPVSVYEEVNIAFENCQSPTYAQSG